MTTIFKIYAIEMFIKQNNNQLSFKVGQQFYALSFDSENRFYYVSTHYRTPFCRNAYTGLVPSDYFVIVDDFGNLDTQLQCFDTRKIAIK